MLFEIKASSSTWLHLVLLQELLMLLIPNSVINSAITYTDSTTCRVATGKHVAKWRHCHEILCDSIIVHLSAVIAMALIRVHASTVSLVMLKRTV